MLKLEEAAREYNVKWWKNDWEKPNAALTELLEAVQTHPEWTPAQVDSINYEMSEQIIAEIRETLEQLGCCHGHDMKSTPPMFYREAILCAVKAAWERGRDGKTL